MRLRLAAIITICPLLTGCIIWPIPSAIEAREGFQCDLTDAKSKQPISDATIEVTRTVAPDYKWREYRPFRTERLTSCSFSDGAVEVPGEKYWRIWIIGMPGQCPFPSVPCEAQPDTLYIQKIVVTHPDYQTFQWERPVTKAGREVDPPAKISLTKSTH